MEQDIPDYDMDSEDERFVNAQAKKMDLTPLKVFYNDLNFFIIIFNFNKNFFVLFEHQN